ncbi:MAG: DUF6516 family protein [Methanosarcinales archaeon]
MISDLLYELAHIAETEFADVVIGYELIDGKLRLYISDGTLLDVWYSRRITGRYAYHWERRYLNNTIYRWDNARHRIWNNISTFPHHFHESDDRNVKESYLPQEPENAIRYVLEYIRNALRV